MSEAAALVEGIAREGLAELHTHLGGSVDASVLWTLAHEQGILLPVDDYFDFVELVTIDPRGVKGLPELDAIYRWTELIQSSPIAVQRSVHGAIGGAYRTQNITTLELRFNPMKRNRGGERDLDHIIMAATRGLDLAQLEYPKVRAGLILMMDRTFAREQNEVIVEKAIRYAGRGIVGVDYAMSSSSLVRIGALDGDGARGVNARARGHVRRTVRHAGSDMTLAESVR